MTQEVLKLALEALEACNRNDMEEVNEAITAIKEALAQLEQWGASAVTHPEYVAEQKRKTEELRSRLAQPEQEPVKDWVASHNAICALLRQAHDALALTSYPMMHRWVGLTDDEMEATFIECGGKWNGDFWKIEDADFHPFLRTIEAKLKEKL